METLGARAEAAEAARSAAEREKLRADAVADAEATRARTLENHLRVVEASRTTVAEEAETQRRAQGDEIVALEAEVARATAELMAADAHADDDDKADKRPRGRRDRDDAMTNSRRGWCPCSRWIGRRGTVKDGENAKDGRGETRASVRRVT